MKQQNQWILLMSTSIVSFMSTIDASIVNIAIPKISRDLSVLNNQAEWIVSIYLVLICILLLFFGKLSDQIGRVKIFQIGTLIFVGGSLLCGLSTNLPMILGARAVQALGASMTMATNFSIITDIFPPNQHGIALGFNSSFVQVGNIAGPGVGGLILTWLNWHFIFFVNVPIGIVAYLLGHHFFPKSKPQSGHFRVDVPGFASYSVMIATFFLTIFWGQVVGFGDLRIVGLMILTLGLISLFVWIEHRVAEPLIDLRVFHNLGFTFGILSAMLVYACGYFNNVIMPFYLQDRLLLSSATAGLILMAVPMLNIFSAPTGGYIADRIGAEKVSFYALFIFLVPEIIFIFVQPKWSLLWLVIGLALFGTANGAFQNNPMIMGNAAPEFQGVAGSIAALGRNLGMAIGLALATSLLYFGISLRGGQKTTTYPDAHPDWFVAGMHFAYTIALSMILIAIGLLAIVLVKKRMVKNKTL
ncbi:MFS transporter [Lentilactobacillus fungorum]|uniref:MFS transporter n=1 Tax=Lentilactobacillus fungorum TaxID=2201250 RepID=A0ABQ3VY09_9LACO|nr:MFS transporter [Lentilactobacillus fungorum]GHP13283.1 MFS transporter [Lentilactobacillus fungorum]